MTSESAVIAPTTPSTDAIIRPRVLPACASNARTRGPGPADQSRGADAAASCATSRDRAAANWTEEPQIVADAASDSPFSRLTLVSGRLRASDARDPGGCGAECRTA